MDKKNISHHFKNRKTELMDILNAKSNQEIYEEKLNKLEESILSIDISKTYNILLSWGGPSDGFKINTDQNNELIGIRYWFADWFTYDEIKLPENEKEDFLSVYGYLLDGLDIKY